MNPEKEGRYEELESESLQKVRINLEGEETAVEGTPKGYYPEYLGKIDEGTWFVIFAPSPEPDETFLNLTPEQVKNRLAGSYPYDKYRVMIGKPDNLRELELTKPVKRLRDGGTTFVTTGEGEFFFPSSIGFYQDKKPTFNKREIDLFPPPEE